MHKHKCHLYLPTQKLYNEIVIENRLIYIQNSFEGQELLDTAFLSERDRMTVHVSETSSLGTVNDLLDDLGHSPAFFRMFEN